MAKAHSIPKLAYTRQHVIRQHAIERLREYATDIGSSSRDLELGDIIDEVVCEALRDKTYEECLDIRGLPCILIPFNREFWADPGLVVMAHEDEALDPKTGTPRKQVRTILTAGAIDDMKNKKKLIPQAKPAALAPLLVPPLVNEQEVFAAAVRESISSGPLTSGDPAAFATVVPLEAPLQPSLAPVRLVEATAPVGKDVEAMQREITALTYDIKELRTLYVTATSMLDLLRQVTAKRELEYQRSEAQRELAERLLLKIFTGKYKEA